MNRLPRSPYYAPGNMPPRPWRYPPFNRFPPNPNFYQQVYGFQRPPFNQGPEMYMINRPKLPSSNVSTTPRQTSNIPSVPPKPSYSSDVLEPQSASYSSDVPVPLSTSESYTLPLTISSPPRHPNSSKPIRYHRNQTFNVPQPAVYSPLMQPNLPMPNVQPPPYPTFNMPPPAMYPPLMQPNLPMPNVKPPPYPTFNIPPPAMYSPLMQPNLPMPSVQPPPYPTFNMPPPAMYSSLMQQNLPMPYEQSPPYQTFNMPPPVMSSSQAQPNLPIPCEQSPRSQSFSASWEHSPSIPHPATPSYPEDHFKGNLEEVARPDRPLNPFIFPYPEDAIPYEYRRFRKNSI